MLPLLVAVAAAADPLPFSPADAEPLPRPSAEQIERLQPRHHLLPQNPRGQIDFTAYTLEWGEVRVGLAGVAVGVLPRTQIGTAPVLDALGAGNAQIKVNAVRAGPLDLAATGTWASLSRDALDASYYGAGAALSLQLLPPWSLHASGTWMRAEVEGRPSLDAFGFMLGQYTGSSVDDKALSAAEDQLTFRAQVDAVTAKVATDVRLNRRDSVIVQGQAVVHATIDTPDYAQAYVADSSGPVPVQDAYMASLAYQASFRHLDLRLGAGVSSVPGAWLLNTVDVAWRFGGKTRIEERRMRKGWRENRKDLARSWREGRAPDQVD